MTTEKTVPTEESPIIDETPPEQVALEEQILTGTPAVPAEPPEAEAAATVPAAAAPAPVKAEEPKPETKPSVYTEEQVRKMQASWDRQIAEAKKRADEHQRKLQELDLGAQVEAHLRAQERQLEGQVGADEARKAVRTAENERQVKEYYAAQAEVRTLREAQQQARTQEEFQAKIIVAQSLASRYGVSRDDAELLLDTATPVAMERLAQKLGTTAQQKGQSAEQLRKAVPVETSQTKLESGMSGTAAPESTDRMTERLNNTPSWEWNEREREFMRTGRVK